MKRLARPGLVVLCGGLALVGFLYLRAKGASCSAQYRGRWKPEEVVDPLEVANDVVAQCPRSSTAQVMRARALLHHGRVGEAQQALDRAIEIDDDWVPALKQQVVVMRRTAEIGASARPAENAAPEETAAQAQVQEIAARQVIAIPGVTGGFGGLDPRVNMIMNSWFGFVSDAVSLAVGGQGSAMGGTMWIPGVTDSTWGAVPTQITSGPTPASGPVADDAEVQCARSVIREFEAEFDASDRSLMDCLQRCHSKQACRSRCDARYIPARRSIQDRARAEIAARCYPPPPSEPCCSLTPPTVAAGQQGLGKIATPLLAGGCAGFGDCASCTRQERCGWCSGTGSCVESATAEGSSQCPSGWAPFPQSCVDACRNFASCGLCTAQDYCGWCAATSTCYGGLLEGARAGVCEGEAWQPTPESCPN